MPFTKEEVTSLAFKRYVSGENVDNSIWYLAELSATINKNVRGGYDINPLETDNLVLLIRENVNGEVIKPKEEEIKELAAIIHNEGPSKSQLHWFIAEKTLLLREIEEIIKENRNSE